MAEDVADNFQFCEPCMENDEPNIAVNHCKDCIENLCVDCANIHTKMKATKHHQLINLDDVRKTLIAKKPSAIQRIVSKINARTEADQKTQVSSVLGKKKDTFSLCTVDGQ